MAYAEEQEEKKVFLKNNFGYVKVGVVVVVVLGINFRLCRRDMVEIINKVTRIYL